MAPIVIDEEDEEVHEAFPSAPPGDLSGPPGGSGPPGNLTAIPPPCPPAAPPRPIEGLPESLQSPRLAPAPWEPPLPLWQPAGFPPCLWSDPYAATPAVDAWGISGAAPASLSPVHTQDSPDEKTVGQPSHAATEQGAVTASPNGKVVGLEKDSPRSVLLTLCGAWGALSASKDARPGAAPDGATQGKQLLDMLCAGASTSRLTRQQLLMFRRTVPDQQPTAALKTLHVSRIV